jgi:hypothetical protein
MWIKLKSMIVAMLALCITFYLVISLMMVVALLLSGNSTLLSYIVWSDVHKTVLPLFVLLVLIKGTYINFIKPFLIGRNNENIEGTDKF